MWNYLTENVGYSQSTQVANYSDSTALMTAYNCNSQHRDEMAKHRDAVARLGLISMPLQGLHMASMDLILNRIAIFSIPT